MNKNSSFRTRILPWILYALGTVATIAAIILRVAIHPEIFPAVNTLILVAAGFIAGLVLIIFTNKNLTSSTEYFSLREITIVCWVGCIIVIATLTDVSWVYYICLPLAVGCIPYMFLYIRSYLNRKEQVFKRMNTPMPK